MVLLKFNPSCDSFSAVQSWLFFSSVEMGSVGDKLDIESDEEISFSSSHATNKIESLHFESAHMASPRSFYSSRVLRKVHQISYFRSVYFVILKAKINVLLPFGPLAILLHYLTKKHV